MNTRKFLAIAVVGLTLGAASAAFGIVIPPNGGAGRGCAAHRIGKAVVDAPHGATLVLRHPGRQTRVRVNGPIPYHVRSSRHQVVVVSDTVRQLRFHATCEASR